MSTPALGTTGPAPAAPPDVFVVPVCDRWLLHAPLHGVTALVNSAAVAQLRRNANSFGALGTLLSSPLHARPCPPQGDVHPRFVGLVTTRACNLACAYCAFGSAQAGEEPMDLSLAAAAVDWMADWSRQHQQPAFEVHFFGGEPFCAPEVVEVAVHRARARAAQSGLIPRFEVATNGYFDDRRCTFIGDYFDAVVLSFDGPEEVHDRNRPLRSGRGSYATLARNAQSLSRSGAKLCLRMCVTRDTVDQLEETTRWTCETFRPDCLDFESLQPNPQSQAAGLEPAEPRRFAEMYLRAARVADSFGVSAVYAASSLEKPRHTFCPVGTDAVIVAADGRVSACYLLEEEWRQRGLDLNFGRLEPGSSLRIDATALQRVRELTRGRQGCTRCLARWHCAGGCHVHHASPRQSGEYDAFCVQTRLIVASRLLESIGRAEEVDRLLANREALDLLAFQGSDSLVDWGEA